MPLILLAFILFLAPAQAQNQPPASKEATQPQTGQSSPPTPSAVSQPTDGKKDQGESASSQAHPPVSEQSNAWAVIVAFATGVQAIAAICAVLIYDRQTRLMRHSANVIRQQARIMAIQARDAREATRIQNDISERSVAAANLSAKAAETNATALINSNRAWVMVDVEWQLGAGAVLTNDTTTHIFVDHICGNIGTSAAQIIEKGYVFKNVHILPQKPDFTDIVIFQHYSEYLASNGSPARFKLSGIECQGHLNHNLMMVLYGRVRYRDVYGEHETQFGYHITQGRNLQRMPVESYPEYNKHT